MSYIYTVIVLKNFIILGLSPNYFQVPRKVFSGQHNS
ncbi:hypothetical protein B879_03588 [Cecembia lonarensis LW9]|uniref:Uncharacterized protein n=1 Tax=Cecembia lonarensis (strain CCUG 58316 / KCTC 22772 / LW9) TaxID=1225176 RepID=K1LUM1_CECL9|nr:hypothetical protein B879_03588 [Cecembia lonarensis LW9]